jgi:uncharacterized protein
MAMRIPIQIERNGGCLLGMFHLATYPAVGAPLLVVNYGLNGDRVDNHRLAVLLARRANLAGISVVRYDYAGCGVSSGEFPETSISSKVEDARAVLNFIKGCQEGPSRIFLLGYSDGVRIVHQLVASMSGINGFVLWNPVVKSMTRTFRSSQKRAVLEPTTRKLLFPLFGVYMGLNYLREANGDLDVHALLGHRVPKTIFFGTGDVHTLTFQQDLKPLLPEYPDVEVQEINGANHLFNRTEWSESLVERTVGWILRTCECE